MDLDKYGLRDKKKAKQKATILIEFIKLMESAYRFHDSKSVDDVSISEVCKSAFVSDMVFYNYFEKKENAIITLVELWFMEIQYILDQNKDKSADERWDIFVDFHLGTQSNSPNFTAGIFMTLLKGGSAISTFFLNELESYFFFSEFQFYSKNSGKLQGIEQLQPVAPDKLFAGLLGQFLTEYKIKSQYSMEELVVWLTSQFWGVSTFSSYINNFNILKNIYRNVLKDMFLKK